MLPRPAVNAPHRKYNFILDDCLQFNSQQQTPFRPPPHSTRSAGPQFASTPRFLFSQTQKPHHDNDANESELPSTTSRNDRKPLVGSTPRQREVIDDATDEDELDEREREPDTARPAKDGIFDDYSSPPDAAEAEAAGDVDSEFEDLFALPTERAKRRRVSAETATATATTPVRPRDDTTILTSSPEPQSWNEPPVTPFPRRPRPQDHNAATNETPKPPPGPASAKPFRHHPRFMLSASQAPSSQVRVPLTPASQTPTSTSASRRKPAFVLPRSPSPSREDEDHASLPTPFSPSSRTLHRRGRARSNAPGYVPGGMASEVRSWVLEMGTKREQLQPSPGRQMFSSETKKYLITGRITKVRRSALGSSGPFTFVEAQVQQPAEAGVGESRNILLMGSPSFRPGYHELQVDDVIGIYRGLVWEIELNQDGIDDLLRKSSIPADLTGYKNSDDPEKWLVVMEWDLLQ